MSRRLWIAAFLVLAASACNTPAGSFPPPPVPPMQPAPPAVGHWTLEASSTGEHLRIEADGTFVEGGGSPFDVGCCTLSEGETWSGAWVFTAPDQLTLDDVTTGPHAYRAFVHGIELVLQADQARTYRFAPEETDAGAD